VDLPDFAPVASPFDESANPVNLFQCFAHPIRNDFVGCGDLDPEFFEECLRGDRSAVHRCQDGSRERP
jgi:hypothetical protein